jgi:hypothetical protein
MGAEVMLAVRVVFWGEVIEASDFQKRVGRDHIGERRDARCHDDLAAREGFAERVVELADASRFLRLDRLLEGSSLRSLSPSPW